MMTSEITCSIPVPGTWLQQSCKNISRGVPNHSCVYLPVVGFDWSEFLSLSYGHKTGIVRVGEDTTGDVNEDSIALKLGKDS